jgi:hypothetical protein
MARQQFTITVPGFTKKLVIYGEQANINYFVQPDLEPDDTSEAVLATVQVRSHSRKYYPGQITSSSVDGHSRKVLTGLGRGNGSALPGKSFVLVENEDEPDSERRQFTFTGTIAMLTIFLRANAQRDLILYTNKGTDIRIPAAAGS